MRVAYLVNQYPQPSLTFIRREVAALEAQGVAVDRHTLRPPPRDLADADDRAEAAKTRAILAGGPLRKAWTLLSATLLNLAARPAATLAAFALAARISRGSDRGLIAHLAYAAEACELRRRLAADGVTRLHAHFATNPAAVAMLCRVAGGRGGPAYSFTVHGQKGLDLPGPNSLREKVRRAAFVACISDFTRSAVMLRCDPGDWPKLHVVRCGLDRGLLDATPTPVPDRPRIVCVGRLAVEKGHSLLLDAAATLRDEGVDFELLFVGDGELRPAIERMVGDLGLGGRVTLVGWADAAGVREAIEGSRLLVMQSFIEGLPVVLMEAFALGRPAAAPWIAGIPELIEHGRSGWLFPAGNADALAEALRQALAADPEALAAMAARGRAAVLERHDVDRNAALLRGLFEAVPPAPTASAVSARAPVAALRRAAVL